MGSSICEYVSDCVFDAGHEELERASLLIQEGEAQEPHSASAITEAMKLDSLASWCHWEKSNSEHLG